MRRKTISIFVTLLILVFSFGGVVYMASETPYSTPTMSPLYEAPPNEYRDNWGMTIMFKTDPEVLARMVPEPLQPNEDGLMGVQISEFFVSGFGRYNEMIFFTPVTFNGELGNFSHYLMLDNDIATGGGREIWGFPKKMGRVELEEKDGVLTGTVERGGHLLVKASMQIGRMSRPEDLGGSATYYNHKLIPSVIEGAPPVVNKLTSTTLENVVIKKVYNGRATLEFGKSPVDRFHEIPIIEVLDGVYVNSDFDLTFGEVIHDYSLNQNPLVSSFINFVKK